MTVLRASARQTANLPKRKSPLDKSQTKFVKEKNIDGEADDIIIEE